MNLIKMIKEMFRFIYELLVADRGIIEVPNIKLYEASNSFEMKQKV